MPDIVVLKGIPLPKPVGSRRPTTKYPFASMDVDDSFFLPDRTTTQFATYASLWGRKLKRKFKTRTVYMHQPRKGAPWEECTPEQRGAVCGVGVWRTE